MTMIVLVSVHQVRCIPWVQMGTFNKEIGILCGIKFFALNIFCWEYLQLSLHLMLQIWWKPLLWNMRKTTRLKSGWGFCQTNSPLSTARVLIDAVGLCLLRVNEVWWLFAPDLRRWINSFSGSDFKPRLVYKTWYFCYFITNFDQQF